MEESIKPPAASDNTLEPEMFFENKIQKRLMEAASNKIKYLSMIKV